MSSARRGDQVATDGPVGVGRARPWGWRRAVAASALVSVATLGMAACGSASSGSGSSASGAPSSSGSSGGAGATGGTAIPAPNKKAITMLFGSSGPAETAAEQAAGKAFTAQTGIPVTIQPASNLSQQLSEDFAGNQPPNLFYLDPTTFQQYAKDGVLAAYGQSLGDASSFFPTLTKAFTYKGQLVCDPKDGANLSLYINDADFAAAGLTSADYPTTWDQLSAVARKLTTDGRVGLVVDPSESRLDAFLYQAGGSVLDPAGTKVVLDSADDVKGLSYVKSLLDAKVLAFPSQLNESDEIPALGAGKAAMAITGPWMEGEMSQDYPGVKYTVVALPAGPAGKATLSFTNCWGVPKQNDNLGGTVELVKYLTSPAQELRFAEAFGAIPSLQSVAAQYEKLYPQNAEELTSTSFAHADIAIAGATNALTAFDSGLAQLGSQTPASILSSAQTNLQAVVAQNQGG